MSEQESRFTRRGLIKGGAIGAAGIGIAVVGRDGIAFVAGRCSHSSFFRKVSSSFTGVRISAALAFACSARSFRSSTNSAASASRFNRSASACSSRSLCSCCDRVSNSVNCWSVKASTAGTCCTAPHATNAATR